MPRNFSSAGDFITVSNPANNYTFGTIVALVRDANQGVARSITRYERTSTGDEYSLRIDSSNRPFLQAGLSSQTAPSIVVNNSTGWALVGVSKATGSVKPRFHLYRYDTNTWTHEDAAANLANNAATLNRCRLGGLNGYGGDIAIIGMWARALTDAEIESLPFTLQAWLASAPNNLWLLDQASTADLVADLIDGSANQSAITGTSVGASSVPVFSYGVGPNLAQRQKVVGYKDTATRLKVRVDAFKDVASRLFLRVTGYRFSSTRLYVRVETFRDAASRLFVKVNTFRDVATRLNVLPNSFRNVATRLYLKVNRYADAATRFVLGIRGYADVATRFGMQGPVGMPSATPVNAEAAAILVQSEARAVVTSQTPGASPIAASPGATVTVASPAATPTVASPAAVPGPDQFPGAVVRAVG